MVRGQGQDRKSVSAKPNVVCGSGIRRRSTGNAVRSGCGAGVAAPPRRTPCSAPAADRTPAAAHAFAERTVRAILEALDRRRPLNQLTALVSADVHARLRTLAGGDLAPGRRLGPAVLVRVDIAHDNTPDAEIFARYRRGPRHFALAGRITRSRRHGWRLTALRIN